jgi:DNA-binding MarR family transcriptional regulator
MRRPGFELPLLLLAGFQTIVDETHRRLAEQGHGELRAAHGFAMQAVGRGATVSDVGRTLGITKQAAAKTVDRLVRLGYLKFAADPADARRKIASPTDLGLDMLNRSAVIFEELATEWAASIGRSRLERLEDDLADRVGDRALRLAGLASFLPDGD